MPGEPGQAPRAEKVRPPPCHLQVTLPGGEASDPHPLRIGFPATPSQSRTADKPLSGEKVRTKSLLFPGNCLVGAGQVFPESGVPPPRQELRPREGKPLGGAASRPLRGPSPAASTPGAQPPRLTPGTRRASRRRCENSGNRPLAASAVEKVTSAPEASRTSHAARDRGFRAQGVRRLPDAGCSPSPTLLSPLRPQLEGGEGGRERVPPSLTEPLSPCPQVPDPPLYQLRPPPPQTPPGGLWKG